MIVVAIVGVLATLAIYGVKRYVLAAKTSEASEMIQVIKGAQESYKDETFTYLDVSGSLGTLYPIKLADLGNKKVQWGGGDSDDAKNWKRLGVSANAPVQFGYSCIAGGADKAVPTDGIPAQLNYPANPGAPWYVVKAMADRNANQVYASVIGSSFSDELYVENDTE